MSNSNKQLTKGWQNMVDVQPGFYEGVDWYEQAWKADSTIHLLLAIIFMFCPQITLKWAERKGWRKMLRATGSEENIIINRYQKHKSNYLHFLI